MVLPDMVFAIPVGDDEADTSAIRLRGGEDRGGPSIGLMTEPGGARHADELGHRPHSVDRPPLDLTRRANHLALASSTLAAVIGLRREDAGDVVDELDLSVIYGSYETAALARRHDKFALSYLSSTADGYTVQFRLGAMDIVKTAVEVGVFEDSWRMDRMLDWVGLTFQSYSLALSTPGTPSTAGVR